MGASTMSAVEGLALWSIDPKVIAIGVMVLMGISVSWISLAAFFGSFVRLRNSKIVANTRVRPIRSVDRGVVSIRGKAQSYQPAVSPFSQTRCCFYRAAIEEWQPESKDFSGKVTKAGWTQVRDDADGPRFFLVDDTGKVLVDAHNRPDDPAFYANVFDLPEYFNKVVRSDFPGLNEYMYKRKLEDLASIDKLLHTHFRRRAANRLAPSPTEADPQYQLTEWLVLPGQEYRVIGTCVENPDSQDLNDRRLICKASKKSSFVISSGDLPATAKDLRSRARADIVIMAVASLVGLGLLAVIVLKLLGKIS
jgi:hypothetical protein